jgi:hypothetical protein
LAIRHFSVYGPAQGFLTPILDRLLERPLPFRVHRAGTPTAASIPLLIFRQTPF